ncbi:hypothetical protein JOB18_013031 [Solea senegalensis]|uniref:Uncharacterized protein n=1 Tax=Solea senegalensis TaxID=28829 RepID=A0AAV6PPI1_SOLSE|nr:hypothetical protein JOB18_013031 [Solea senegalensis]
MDCRGDGPHVRRYYLRIYLMQRLGNRVPMITGPGHPVNREQQRQQNARRRRNRNNRRRQRRRRQQQYF